MPTAQPIARHGASLPASARGGAVGAGSVALLRDARGGAVPLQRVAARGRLQGLLFELTVEQHYRNAGPTTLESVFTFPLPLRAALLGFELEIGERKLSAVAAARREASERYERAIDEGDTAALIECAGDGLHTVSVGNLLPGETAVIRYRYAELLDAHEGHVRLNVPTAIAPRYGNPADAGLEGPAIPGTELLAEYPFEIRIELDGITEAGVVHSPSHTVAVSPGPTGLTVALARPGYLDRDFVLEVEQAATPARALVAADGDGYVALASCTLALDRAEHRPLALKILLDCSGSMAGDSIAAAKRALLGILDGLRPEDRISLTRFGSTVEQVSEGLEPADTHTLAPLRAVVAGLDADLGGTEMAGALATVLALPVPAGRQADVILITDGEIYDIAGVIEMAAKSGQRLFAIAIGAAPVEALARGLADRTGSACEFVAPGENAEAAILRTFKRLRAAPRSLAKVTWPIEPAWTALPPAAVFPGDTLHVMAGFNTRPEAGRDIEVLVRDLAEGETRIVLPVAEVLSEGDLIARMAAHRRIGTLDEPEATALALKYQLASRYTSLVVVAERSDAEKAQGSAGDGRRAAHARERVGRGVTRAEHGRGPQAANSVVRRGVRVR